MRRLENTPNRFWNYIRSLVEPSPNIVDIRQRHQARMLSALLLLIIVLGGLSGIIQVLTVPGFFPAFAAILGTIIVLCFAYLLARRKDYLLGATLTALIPLMASYAALLKNTEDQSTFAFMLISILLSSLLLNRWLTLGVAFLNLLGLVLLPVIQPAWTIEIVSGKISIQIIMSALILIAMWHRDMIEFDQQRELSERELKFRSIFDHSVDAIGVSRDGVHIMANPAYMGMFGIESVDKLAGTSILDLIAPSERAKIQANIRRRSLGEGVPAIYETRGLRRDGTEFDMEVHVSTYELEGKLYTVPILRDVTERKKAEEALRASQEAYKLLFESNPQPLWVYDINSLAFLAVNDEAISKYGYSRDEFLRMTIKDIRPKDDLPRLMDNIAHVSAGLDHAGGWRHLKKDGCLIDVEITSHVLLFEGRRAELVIANDITARKAAEKALQESLLRQTAILDNIPDLAWLKDELSRFIAVNEPFSQACGLPPAEVIGKTDLDIWPEELAQGYRKDDHEVMQSGKRKHVEERLVDSAGRERWVETIKTPIFDAGGNLIGTAGISRDITERKQIEDALQKSELRYRAIVESTTDLICRFLPDTTLTFVNEAYCSYFGRTREQLNGTRFLALIPQSDWAGVQSHVDHVVQTRKPVTYSHEVVTPNGEIRWQQWTDSVILDDDGNVIELQSVGRDITEQRLAEKSLQESERRFREMLQGVNLAGVMLDKTGRITFINEFLLRITDWSREDALGKNWFDQFLPPETRDEVREAFKQMSLNREIVPHYENEIMSRHGERRLIRWNNTTLFDTNGAIIGSASIGEDITESRHMERYLRLSEEKFSKAFRASPDVIMMTSLADGRILEVNDSLSYLSGYSREEIVGKTTAELNFWADPADREQYATTLQRDGRVRDLEVGFRIKSGEVRQTLLSGEVIELTDGKYILGVIRDITERKKTEQALRSSEERYRTLAQNLPDSALLLYDHDLRFIIADGPEIEAAGFKREQFEGKTLYEALPAQFVELVEPSMRRTLQTGEKFSAELTFEGRFYRYSYVPLRDGLGNIFMAMILATNITQLKEVESALKDSQRRLSTALQATKVGVWEWDMRTNRAYWSDENYQVLGLDPDSVESKYENWAKSLHPHDLPAAEAKVAEAIKNKSELNIEFRVVWPDGSIHWINDIGNILMDEMGVPLGMYGIQMDVTKRKQAEEEREALINQLEVKNAELERFTYTVSHDLKSPLVTIKGFLGFIKQDIAVGNTERLNNDLERIGNATTKMEELLWDLLELSRIGRLVRPSEKIPFEDLVREASEIVHGQLTARGITVRVQPNLPAVFGDRPRLVEVLQNLLDNAAKYMGDQADPLIEIGLRDVEGDKPIFYVRDNGIGIAPQHHERVFGLFNKLDVHSEGTGVGLALVKRIIEFHGGRIWIESEGNNRGTTFYFTMQAPPTTAPENA